MTTEPVRVQVREHGAVYTLKGAWTVDSVRESVEDFHQLRRASGLPRRCRKRKHDVEVIGEPYTGEIRKGTPSTADLLNDVLLLMSSSDVSALVRCRNCGWVGEQHRGI